MKHLLFALLFVLAACCMQAQVTDSLGFTKARARFEAGTEHNLPIPTNLSTLFGAEIASKIALETGAYIGGAASVATLFSPLTPISQLGVIGFFGGLFGGNLGGTYNYDIGSWAPYVNYSPLNTDDIVQQRVKFKVDVMKISESNPKRYIAIEANVDLYGANIEAQTQTTMRRSNYMDLYSFRIKPVDPTKAIRDGFIPYAINKTATYTNTLTLNVGGSADVSPSPGIGIGGSIGYSASTTSTVQDFEIKSNALNGQAIEWEYNMRNAYDDNPLTGGAFQYKKPTDLIINGALTKWLKDPAELAMGYNPITLVGLYEIPAHVTGPIEFEFEGLQQLMHVEVVGRWGIPGAELSGIGVAVPHYVVLSGKIIVTPDPNDLSNSTITSEVYEAVYNYQQFMDKLNKPLPTLDPPVLPSGCYAIKNKRDPNYNNYASHGGFGVVNYYANREEVNEWEKFNLVYAGKSKDGTKRDVYGIYSQDQRFMQAVPGDAVLKSTTTSVLGDWERWEIIPKAGSPGDFHIRSVGQNRWLSANHNFFGTLGTAAEPGDWEVWSFEAQTTGCVTSPIPSLASASYPPVVPTGVAIEDYTFENGSGAAIVLPESSKVMLNERSTSLSPQTNVTTPGSLTQNLNELTIEAWVKNENAGEAIQGIVSAAGLDFVHLQASADPNVQSAVYVNNGEVYLPAVPLATGEWQHVALVAQSGNSQLYINGAPYGPASTKTFSSIRSAANVLIGKGYGNGRPFSGKVANVRIWNTARTTTELLSNALSFNLNDSPGLLYHSPTNNPLTINAASDCVPVPAEVTNGLQSLTIEGWIYNTSPSENIQAIVSASSPEFVHFQMSGDANVSNAVYFDNGGSMMLPVIPATSAGWHHVAIVVESGNSRVYLDGEQVGATNTTTFSDIKSSNTVSVGKGWSGGRVFSGHIADVRIWQNRALTQQQLRDYCHTPPPANAAGLAFHLK